MKSPGPRSSFALLALLTLAAWVVPLWEAVAFHTVSILSVTTAGMLTTMLLLWPFLNGTRLSHGRLQKARMCVECHAPRWPAEQALGFCLRCGSVRTPVPAGY